MRRLIAFGSRARGDATVTSDFDLAIEMEPNAPVLAILSAEGDLEEALGIRVSVAELPNARIEAVIRREGVPFEE